MALAPLLYNITFDSQTRILYFWDKAGHEIYHCEIPSPVQTIPFGGVLTSTSDSVIRVPVEQAGGVIEVYAQPAPALPTVSVSGDFDTYNWLFGTNTPNGIVTISANSICELYNHIGSSPIEWTKNQFDNSKSYAVLKWYSGTSSADVGQNGDLSIVESNGYIAAKNNTSSTLNLYALRCAVCSSSSATVITVYDSSNNPFNAFQYTSDGTDYYYVLDGTQTDWTDDLGSIGYSLQQIYTAYFSDQGISGSNVTFDGTNRLYDASGSLLYYDSTKTYTLITGYVKNGNENNPSEWGVTCYFREQDSSLHTLGLYVNPAFTFYKILYLVTASPAPALPTVSSESWVNFTARMEDRYKDIAANEQIDVHVGSSFDTVPYDSSLVYAISKIYYNTVIIGHGELQCVDNSGVLAVKNVSSSTIRADGGNYQTCDSTDAIVIMVYDNSNNPYNAFQYTSDGTDYYYVLDGTQTDWTDDLSSIGYRLWNLKVYGEYGNSFSLNNKNNFMFVETGGTYSMLEGGTASTVWEIFGIYDSNGNELSHESDYIWWINASNIYYKASPTRRVSVAYALLIVKPPIS